MTEPLKRGVCVVLVCGLPGVGKSRLCDGLQGSLATPCRIIEYDRLEESLLVAGADGDDSSLQAWRLTRTVALEERKRMFLETENDMTILMEDNFHLRSMRKQVFRVCQEFAKDLTVFFAILWMTAPVELCGSRNNERERQVGESTIRKLMESEEPPSWEQGESHANAWERACLQVDGRSPDMNAILSFLKSIPSKFDAVQPPYDPRIEAERIEKERRKTLESWRHQADQTLRWCVKTTSQWEQVHAPGYQLAPSANRIRQSILKTLPNIESNQSVKALFLAKFLPTLDGLSASKSDELRAMILENGVQSQHFCSPCFLP